ncbi:MAG: hypothetical protein UW71_C0004G0011 [Parcubacteria group bacterium GW2011_GWB1_44_7]|nr:MAG: hypothetical protein UW71_C0004G0011 [Parcubacteria group bacterium GW2011_GWB1_44_7]
MSNEITKPKLFFVPHYVGSLRYFEKLLPHLTGRYEVRFLLLFVHQVTYGEMLAYCRQRDLAYDLVVPPKAIDNSRKTKFPVFSLIRDLISYKKQILSLLNGQRIKKIISVNDGGIYVGYLMTEANRRGIDTAVLQWALAYEGQRERPKKEIFVWRRILYQLIKPVYIAFKKAVVLLILDFYQTKGVPGGGTAKRFGIINQQAWEFFRKQGVPPEKMTVVGYLDFHLAEAKKKQLDADGLARKKAAETLGLDLGKKQIVIFTSAYNSRVVNVLNDNGQYQFYENIVKIIKQIYPKESHEIIIKPHPIERTELYQPLEKFGVKIFANLADNFTLVYFSDLYIADSSTANFIPITMGKKTIFINFFHLPLIEKSAPYFGIKGFITNQDEFRSLLQKHKAGILDYQYETKKEIITPDSLTKILNWIG